jgi:hypothetical protein
LLPLAGFQRGNIWSDPTASREVVFTKISRILCADRVEDRGLGHKRWQSEYDGTEIFDSILRGSETNSEQLIHVERSKWVRWVHDANQSRKCFSTTKGYIGLGPQSYQLSDTVVIFFGVNVSFVLRPRDNGFYELIGEAYVEGIMFGEYLDGSLPSQIFRTTLYNIYVIHVV